MTVVEHDHINRERFRTDKAYRAGVLDGVAMETEAEERERVQARRQARENWKAVLRARCFGWDRPDWCCYFWFVGWDCLSIGFHVCIGGPNIEIHLPFGFLRIGRHTNVTARRRMAEEPSDA